MPSPQRVSIEQIVESYRSTGSIWKTAKILGVCGQSIWERLKAIDYPISRQKWTEEEYVELRELAKSCTISRIAERLGRPYYAVAIKISRLGLGERYGNRQKRKLPRGSGFTKATVNQLVSRLQSHEGTIHQFCKMFSYDLEVVVQALQKYDPSFWEQYVKTHSNIPISVCPYCHNEFYPMTAKQKTCSRKCSDDMKRDESYFGGNRRKTVGLAEGICQLCLQLKDSGLSAHHVLGKQHDPNNECLVALCRGCHHLVGTLAGRRFVDSNEGWENLITLVMARRMAEKSKEYVGAYACVELEYLDMEAIGEMAAELQPSTLPEPKKRTERPRNTRDMYFDELGEF